MQEHRSDGSAREDGREVTNGPVKVPTRLHFAGSGDQHRAVARSRTSAAVACGHACPNRAGEVRSRQQTFITIGSTVSPCCTASAFSGGRVSYANQFLRSRSYREAIEAGRISRGEFGTDPCRTLFGRIAAFFKPRLTDNANVSINKLGDEVVAFTETRLPIRFDPSTLETLGVFEYQSDVRGQVSIAHPHLDFRRRCSYSYVLKFGRRSEYRIFRIAWDENRQNVICTIPADKPAYMHSFGMTERYLILAEFPLVVNPLRLKFSGKPFIQNYQWEKHRGVRFHVVEKDSGRVIAATESDACFSFHHVNAFEEDGQIVVDLAAYPDAGVIDQLYLSRLRSDQPVTATAKLTRFRMDLSGSNKVRSAGPRGRRGSNCRASITAAMQAGPIGFVYGAGNQRSGDFIDNIVKVNVQTGEAVTWFEDGCYPGEPVFVASPDSNCGGRRRPSVRGSGCEQPTIVPARSGRGEPHGACARRSAASYPVRIPRQLSGSRLRSGVVSRSAPVTRAFAEEGARVFLASRTLAGLDALAGKIAASGAVAETAQVDALEVDAAETFTANMADKAGRIDVVLNAIGFDTLQGVPIVDLGCRITSSLSAARERVTRC